MIYLFVPFYTFHPHQHSENCPCSPRKLLWECKIICINISLYSIIPGWRQKSHCCWCSVEESSWVGEWFSSFVAWVWSCHCTIRVHKIIVFFYIFNKSSTCSWVCKAGRAEWGSPGGRRSCWWRWRRSRSSPGGWSPAPGTPPPPGSHRWSCSSSAWTG